jgi:hypothetical protein
MSILLFARWSDLLPQVFIEYFGRISHMQNGLVTVDWAWQRLLPFQGMRQSDTRIAEMMCGPLRLCPRTAPQHKNLCSPFRLISQLSSPIGRGMLNREGLGPRASRETIKRLEMLLD